MAGEITLQGFDETVRRLRLTVPEVRQAFNKAIRFSRVDGFRHGLRLMEAETGIPKANLRYSRRVVTDTQVQPNGNIAAYIWIGQEPYLVRYSKRGPTEEELAAEPNRNRIRRSIPESRRAEMARQVRDTMERSFVRVFEGFAGDIVRGV